MAHGRSKYQSRESRARVREILFRDWDPIGINDDPDASRQYVRYADAAYVMLMDERAGSEAIARYLFGVAVELMGLRDIERQERLSQEAARILVSLRPEFETH